MKDLVLQVTVRLGSKRSNLEAHFFCLLAYKTWRTRQIKCGVSSFGKQICSGVSVERNNILPWGNQRIGKATEGRFLKPEPDHICFDLQGPQLHANWRVLVPSLGYPQFLGKSSTRNLQASVGKNRSFFSYNNSKSLLLMFFQIGYWNLLYFLIKCTQFPSNARASI